MTKSKVLICPYCGETQPAGERCRACSGLFEPLSRQATHNDMGPWTIRDPNRPFHPGCSYETIIKLIERGQITKTTIIRGPTTKQFWTIARRVPGVAHLLGYCHSCDAPVDVEDHGCHSCGVPFGAYLDRNYLGLPEVRPMPWEPGVDEAGRPAGSVAPRVDFRLAAQPLGISSFASDTELRGGGGVAMTRFESGPAGTMATASAAGSNFAVSPDISAVASPEQQAVASAPAPTVQALTAASAAQRKLNQQRVMIRWLVVGLIAAVACSTLTMVLLLQSRESEPAAITDDRSDVPSISVDAPANETAAPVEPPPPVLDFSAEQSRVDELLAIVAQEDQPPDVRIQSAEEALRILKDIDARTETSQKPAGLAEQIAAVEKKLDELRLKTFFP